jgi:TonB family protein
VIRARRKFGIVRALAAAVTLSGIALPGGWSQVPAGAAWSPGTQTSTTGENSNEANGSRISVDVLSDTQGVQFGPYLRNLLAHVRKSWPAFMPNDEAKRGESTVIVEFEILPNGKIAHDAKIASSSGDAEVDQAAIFAVRYWKIFDPLPQEFHGPSLKVRVTFARRPDQPSPPDPSSTQPNPRAVPIPGIGIGYGVEILSDTQGIDFRDYIRRMLAEIKRQWEAVMPEEARMGEKGAMFAVFSIQPDGKLSPDSPQLERGSGKTELDKAALDSIRNSEPFDSLPSQFHGPLLKLRVAFLYNLRPDDAGLQPPAGKN